MARYDVDTYGTATYTAPGTTTQTGSGSPITITGLVNGYRYSGVRVRARNAQGWGPWSALSAPFTPRVTPYATITASLSGTGHLTGAVRRAGSFVVTLTGSGAVSGAIIRTAAVTAAVTGSGSMFGQLAVAPLSATITAPTAGSTVSSGVVTITATATGPIAFMEFWEGNVRLGTDNTAPYSFDWSPVPGSHTIDVVANDGFLPEPPNPDGVHRVASTSVTFTVSGQIAATMSATLSGSGGAAAILSPVMAPTLAGTGAVQATMSTVLRGTLVGAGSVPASLTATPRLVDMLTGSGSMFATVSAVATMTATVTFPANGATYDQAIYTLTANASGPVAFVEFWADSVKLGTDSTAPYSFTWDARSLTGSHSIVAVANDGSGVNGVFDVHRVASATATVTLATTTVLVGEAVFPTSGDGSTNAGEAFAFSYAAAANGTVHNLVYEVSQGVSTATSVMLGLYSNSAGSPGTLLGSGTVAGTPQIGVPVTVTGLNVAVTSGTTYWLAVLGLGGVVNAFGVETGSHAGVFVTSQATLASTWPGGGTPLTVATVPFRATGLLAPVPILVTSPAITGTATTGNVLTCSSGSWNPAATSFAYQWKRGATSIGTNASTYTLVSADVGLSITCTVTATNAAGSGTPAVSNAVTPTAGAFVFPTIPAGSTLVKSLDWEDGQAKNTSTWSGGTIFYSGASTDGVANARMQVVTSAGPTVTGIPTPSSPGTIAQGTRCLYCEVRQGDALIAGGPRSQISGGYLANAHEYIAVMRFRMLTTSSYPGTTGQYFLFWEMHTDTSVGGQSPTMALFIDGNKPTPALSLVRGDGSASFWSGSGAVDTWHAIAVRWFQGTSGWIELWYDGAWQTMISGSTGPNGVSRRTIDTIQGSTTGLYPMFGIYQGGDVAHTGTLQLYHDEQKIYQVT